MTRLRRSNPSSRGYSRRHSGRGFSYLDPSNGIVTDPALRARFAAIAIPPAWTDVWICPHPNGHIQATGVDAAGRRQYIYHPSWREEKDGIKFDRALDLAATLPAARGQVTRMLRTAGFSKERALAAAFRMLDTGSLRIGSERYADAYGSHGLSTLLCNHVTVEKDTVTLQFPAKSGQLWESDITDPDLAKYLRLRLRMKRHEVVLGWDADGSWHPLAAADINAFVKERTGSDFSAKDFRTLRGTAAAAESLAKSGPQASQRARTRAIRQGMIDAGEVLGNTAAIARKSYVDPLIVDRYARGETIDLGQASVESRLRAFLVGPSS